jgi:hypothetical protein
MIMSRRVSKHIENEQQIRDLLNEFNNRERGIDTHYYLRECYVDVGDGAWNGDFLRLTVPTSDTDYVYIYPPFKQASTITIMVYGVSYTTSPPLVICRLQSSTCNGAAAGSWTTEASSSSQGCGTGEYDTHTITIPVLSDTKNYRIRVDVTSIIAGNDIVEVRKIYTTA